MLITRDDPRLVPNSQPLVGPIHLGEVLAWEPDNLDAGKFIIVSRIEGSIIWSWDLTYSSEVWNDESRVREACALTMFHRFPVSPPIRGPIAAAPIIGAAANRRRACSIANAPRRHALTRTCIGTGNRHSVREKVFG